MKNRDTGDQQTAEMISHLYLNHGIFAGSLLDYEGKIVDLTNCLAYSPKNTFCMVSKVYAYLGLGNKAFRLVGSK